MENSGLYFVGRCESPNCAYYKRLTTIYIGRGRTFDFVKERRKCMCGHCFSAMIDIVYVLFYDCRWSYCGQLLSGERRQSEHEQRTSSHEFFPEDKQELLWKWLKFTIGEESSARKCAHQSTQTSPDAPSRNSVAVQTESQFAFLTTGEKVIDEEVVDALVFSEKRYHEKYKSLKRALSLKKVKTSDL